MGNLATRSLAYCFSISEVISFKSYLYWISDLTPRVLIKAAYSKIQSTSSLVPSGWLLKETDMIKLQFQLPSALMAVLHKQPIKKFHSLGWGWGGGGGEGC